MNRLVFGLLLAVLLMSSSIAGGGFGVGAFPLSRTTVSMWLLGATSDEKSQPLVLVYFTGPEDWHRGKWESKIDGKVEEDDRVSYRLTSATATLEIALTPDRKNVSVQGREFSLSQANVFVVKKANDPAKQQVETVGRLELPAGSEEPLAVAVLKANPRIKSFLR